MKTNCIGIVCFAVSLAGVAQTAPPQVRVVPQTSQPSGTVTGHVYCADTQRPARFADVELLQLADTSGRQGTTSSGPMYRAAGGRARTALDGSFLITNVPAGDYYVVGTMTGYISPQAVSRMTQNPIQGAPSAHVEANHSADVVVSMTRGAVVSGRVSYDDGSPIPGVSVRLRPVSTPDPTGVRGGFLGGFGGGSFGGGDLGFGQTDDRGVFRLAGIPPGRYNMVTTVQTESTGQARGGGRGGFGGGGFAPTLTVYAPAAMRKTEAQVIEIGGGGTVEGIDIRVALSGLKTVQGGVESKTDGHMLNGGMVSLADAADASLTRTAAIDSEGRYRLEYLPAGTYTLTVNGVDRSDNGGRPGVGGTTKRYTKGTATVTVGDGDVTVDTVQLDEAPSTTTAASGGN